MKATEIVLCNAIIPATMLLCAENSLKHRRLNSKLSESWHNKLHPDDKPTATSTSDSSKDGIASNVSSSPITTSPPATSPSPQSTSSKVSDASYTLVPSVAELAQGIHQSLLQSPKPSKTTIAESPPRKHKSRSKKEKSPDRLPVGSPTVLGEDL